MLAQLLEWWQLMLYRIMKWVFRWLYGTCELQRVCKTQKEGYDRTIAVEKSLSRSRTESLKRITTSQEVDVSDAVHHILFIKHISTDTPANSQFVPNLSKCLVQICGYTELKYKAKALKTTAYNCDNNEHENMLQNLWNQLCPDTPLENRISKQWTEIGFQGSNPETDFRGMGILSLEQLLYFVGNHTEIARKILGHSRHPKYGYSMAIVGIHLTELACTLLDEDELKPHFYTTTLLPNMDGFHKVYCYLVVEFDSFWREEKPENVLRFNEIKEKFRLLTIRKLKTARVLQSYELL